MGKISEVIDEARKDLSRRTKSPDGQSPPAVAGARRIRRIQGVDPLPRGAIYVGWTSPWRNPFSTMKYGYDKALELYKDRMAALSLEERVRFLEPLRGASALVCECGLDMPCHANVLVELLDGEPQNHPVSTFELNEWHNQLLRLATRLSRHEVAASQDELQKTAEELERLARDVDAVKTRRWIPQDTPLFGPEG